MFLMCVRTESHPSVYTRTLAPNCPCFPLPQLVWYFPTVRLLVLLFLYVWQRGCDFTTWALSSWLWSLSGWRSRSAQGYLRSWWLRLALSKQAFWRHRERRGKIRDAIGQQISQPTEGCTLAHSGHKQNNVGTVNTKSLHSYSTRFVWYSR